MQLNVAQMIFQTGLGRKYRTESRVFLRFVLQTEMAVYKCSAQLFLSYNVRYLQRTFCSYFKITGLSLDSP